MANTITITKKANGKVDIESTVRNPKSLEPALDVYKNPNGKTVTVTRFSNEVIESFDYNEVLQVVRDDGTIVPITDQSTLYNELKEYFFFRSAVGSGGTFDTSLFKITYYEITDISVGTSGSLQEKPAGATIQEGEFGESGNSLLSTLNAQSKPTQESPIDGNSDIVTVDLDVNGDWDASNVYPSPVALIYTFTISGADYPNIDLNNVLSFYKIAEEAEGTNIVSKVEVLQDEDDNVIPYIITAGNQEPIGLAVNIPDIGTSEDGQISIELPSVSGTAGNTRVKFHVLANGIEVSSTAEPIAIGNSTIPVSEVIVITRPYSIIGNVEITIEVEAINTAVTIDNSTGAFLSFIRFKDVTVLNTVLPVGMNNQILYDNGDGSYEFDYRKLVYRSFEVADNEGSANLNSGQFFGFSTILDASFYDFAAVILNQINLSNTQQFTLRIGVYDLATELLLSQGEQLLTDTSEREWLFPMGVPIDLRDPLRVYILIGVNDNVGGGALQHFRQTANQLNDVNFSFTASVPVGVLPNDLGTLTRSSSNNKFQLALFS